MATVAEPVKEIRKVSTILEQIQKLDEQRAKLLDGAKNEALTKATAAIADLNGLGFHYQLVEGGKPAKKTGTRNTDPAKKHCALCQINGHDQRAHRSQGKSKKKFTTKELEELGLAKA